MRISVVIPTHNRVALLREALDSAVRQEPCGADVEIVVVDDSSTDGTQALVAGYPGVRYVLTRQCNPGGTRNVGITESTGDWVAFLDDDDVWLPNKLKRCCELIAAEPDARFAYSAAYICDENLHRGAIWEGPDLTPGRSGIDLFLDTIPATPAVMMHRECFAIVGLFDTNVPRAEDRDMWLKVAGHGLKCVATNEPLVLCRMRDILDGELIERSFNDTMSVVRKHIESAPASGTQPAVRKSAVRRLRGWYAYRMALAAFQAKANGQKADAGRFMRAAYSMSPLHAIKARLQHR